MNYCFHLADDSSYLLKVNLKDKMLIEVKYENSQCKGVPSKIVDLFQSNYNNVEDFVKCFAWDGDGAIVEYVTEFPDLSSLSGGRGFSATIETKQQCGDGAYYAYASYSADYCFVEDTISLLFDSSSCGEGRNKCA